MSSIEARFYPPLAKNSRQKVEGNKVQAHIQHSNKTSFIHPNTQILDGMNRPTVDGLWTPRESNTVLEVYAADCAMIALADNKHIGVFHMGWQQLLEEHNIAKEMLRNFVTSKTKAAISPCIHNLEIEQNLPETKQLLKQFGKDHFQEHSTDKTIFLFQKAIQTLLEASNLSEIEIDNRDTFSSPELDSFRRRKGQPLPNGAGTNYLCIGNSKAYQKDQKNTSGEIISFPQKIISDIG